MRTKPARSDPMATAAQKGREAYLAGKPETANPYRDTRKSDGRLTFGRAWRNAWFGGYRAARQEAVCMAGNDAGETSPQTRTDYCPGVAACMADAKAAS